MGRFLSRTLPTLALCFGATLSGYARAEPVLVELFTSFGCSSCPPADANLSRVAQDENVIVLSYHVDYWNYLGWKDQFSKPEFTERQRRYAQRHNLTSLFTPHALVAGVSSVIGTDIVGLDQAISAHATSPGGIRFEQNGEKILLTGPPFEGTLQIWWAEVIGQQTVNITGGENAGRQITSVNIVKRLSQIGDWQGGQAIELTLPRSPTGSSVLFVQAPGFGRIYGAFALGG